MRKPALRFFSLFALLLSFFICAASAAQMFQPTGLQPNLFNNIERSLRYTPDGQDFVIENGGEFFNRPLYGGNTAFRVDAGDMPEFALYLPGRGGNLRFGIRAIGASGDAKWLHETARITARYRPGEMLYEIRDPLLGADAVLRVHAVALHQTDGLIVRIEASGKLSEGVELLAAYGGVNGKRGKRDGDIGTEAVPIGQYFQLTPEACRGNTFAIDNARFTLRASAASATLAGQFPNAATLSVADAARWKSPASLFATAGVSTPATSALSSPVIVGLMKLTSGSAPLYFSVQRIQETATKSVTSDELADYRDVTTPDRPGTKAQSVVTPLASAYTASDLPKIFADAERHFAALRNQIAVETPDAFINAAVAALNVGADAVWDEPQGAVMHGAIAWRSKLLGWRGPYAMDALGWHERARRHLAYWATRQNTDPISEILPPPDENANLSRSEAALHSNGDMSNTHYDMNTVYIDALFRHILWTGDLVFAREMWPVIERHLAWERRLFRREYGAEKLPLYESYAQIWASDDLQYHGGGTAYGSAYAYYHNTQAARLARALGRDADAAPYELEAALVARGMREFLWQPQMGMFAEYRDLLGLQRAHPSAGLWSFYHTMDANLVTSAEARAMVHYVNTEFPALPVRGAGVPADENYQVLSSTDWMPYTWSVNNVVMGENIHTALGLWQADRPEYAFRLTKSALLASMFMGICPGNVGSLNYLDVYRRESQRDFADGSGVTSRAIVEGLFGIQPDALARQLIITPGFPDQWAHAAIRHSDVSFAFNREGQIDTYKIEQKFPASAETQTLRLRILPRGGFPRVTINGTPAPVPKQLITLTGARLEIEVAPASTTVAPPTATDKGMTILVEWPDISKGGTVALPRAFAAYPPWSAELPAVEDETLRPRAGNANWAFAWRALSDEEIARQKADAQKNAPIKLLASEQDTDTSVNSVTVYNLHSERPLAEPYNWRVQRTFSSKFTTINMWTLFNDRVTQIFKNEYRSPRSPYVSLAIPKQGIGAWAGHVNATAEIDDTGLRAIAAQHSDRFRMPNGVVFVTPGDVDVRNILFTSLWENYPAQAVIPLQGARASHAYFLMAGSTNWMQSRIDNGELIVTYHDGTTTRLALRNPDTWWPIEQDLFYDDYQFRCITPPPARVDMKTGNVRILDAHESKGQGRAISGGAATVLHLPLDPKKQLRSLTLRTLSNEVVIGLMAVTLESEE